MDKQEIRRAIEKLCKWRAVFASWQLGTRTADDPECQAIRDHRELTILLRAEVNALTALLVERGVFTAREFEEHVAFEATHLDHEYEQKFPGFSTHEMGVAIDPARARVTMRNWRP